MLRGAVVVFVAFVPLLASAASPFETFAGASPRVGERAAAVALRDGNGKAVKLPTGHPTVLVFGSFS